MASPTRYAVSTDPTNGETPLTTAPTWGGAGGGDQAAQVYAYQAFQKQFGRAPTQSELTMLAPAYKGTDPNIAATAQGDAAISQYFQGFHNTPTEINKQAGQKNLADAPTHFADVTQQFQNVLGRAPTQDELNHFGSLLASGTTDAYGIQDFLKQQPEYTNQQNQAYQDKLKAQQQTLQDQMKAGNQSFQTDAQGKIDSYLGNVNTQNQDFQKNLSGQLAGYDQQYYQNNILPSIQQAYAKQGRSFDSSAFQNAATQSAQQQNVQRQQYLAGLSADQYNQLQSQRGAMQSNLQNVSAGQYGNLQGQQAAQQAFLQNLGANQYGGVQGNAYQDYANQVANQQNLTNSGINAQYAGVQNTQNRLNQIQDFNTQNQMYNQYLAKYGKRNNGLGGAIGGVIGGGVGAFFGGPAGAMAGYQMGSGLGTAGQNYAGGSY